ncbi:hypothetical protein B4N89_13420 [Embleya scabrispora]|uniref:Uncharacterized protein n=1 Tax=Embleya scabrispora TaxID=159449 RepID=A0A1T3NYR3_9ACTN|nr:hypothetical protein [Embleya scabrispora]OPC81800.1 hypothetical protein B4N89_13420 [Embleya scabrispora]
MTGTPAERQAALDRLAAAAAERTRLAAAQAAGGTIGDRSDHRRQLLAAAVELHAAMLDAHRARVPVAEIALVAGTTVRAITVLLRQEREQAEQLAIDDVAAAVRAHGTAHPITHAAIAAAHARGVAVSALARVSGISLERISAIVLAAGGTQASPAEVAAMRDALITTIVTGPAAQAAEQRGYERLVRGDNPDQ